MLVRMFVCTNAIVYINAYVHAYIHSFIRLCIHLCFAGPNGYMSPIKVNNNTQDIAALTRELRSFADVLHAKLSAINACMRDYERLQGCLELLNSYRKEIRGFIEHRTKGEPVHMVIHKLHISRTRSVSPDRIERSVGGESVRCQYEDPYLRNFVRAVTKHTHLEHAVSGKIRMYVYVVKHICTLIHRYIHTYIHTYIHRYIHTYIHT
jgi:hypothetical protein